MKSYWWVNHKQTYKAELEGGYIWSPKVNKNGARNATYDNLTKVKLGDIVISYAYSEIRAFGTVTGECQEATKPKGFGAVGDNWALNGWFVPIEWTPLAVVLKPKAHLDLITPLLPSKYSPLKTNGKGNQGCYLASISSEFGKLVLDLIEAEQQRDLHLDRLDPKDVRSRNRLPAEELRKVTPEHVWEAVQALISGAEAPGFGPSTDYDLLADEKTRLPPKAVFGLAASSALGFPIKSR